MKKWIEKYNGSLRSLKPVYVLNNFLNRRVLKRNIKLYKKYGVNKSIYYPICSRDFLGLDENKFGFKKRDLLTISDRSKEMLNSWHNNGFLILENFFKTDEIDQLNGEIDFLLKKRILNFNYTQSKIMQAYKWSKKARSFFMHANLLEVLSLLLGQEIIPFQTINFLNGSEQKAHADAFHMSTFPKGNMIAAWIALEDIRDENGPLFYYPGSHKLTYLNIDSVGGARYSKLWIDSDLNSRYEYTLEKMIQKNDLKRKVFMAKKGDVLIWHANLIHGGSPVKKQNATRKSMVCHYYAKGAIAYHEISQRPAIFDKQILQELGQL